MKRILITITVIAAGFFASGLAFADAPITTTDQARAAAGEAAYRASLARTAPDRSDLPQVLTTTDQLRAANGRAQYRAAFHTTSPAHTRPAKWLTTSDEVRLAIGRGLYPAPAKSQATSFVSLHREAFSR